MKNNNITDQKSNTNIAQRLNTQIALTLAELKKAHIDNSNLSALTLFVSCMRFSISDTNSLVFNFESSDKKEAFKDITQTAAAINSYIALIQEKTDMFFISPSNISEHQELYSAILVLINLLHEANGFVEHDVMISDIVK